ncbi:MAG: hypothetical protein JWM21_3930 [Acidobacteria bacterium]|nr:hypothetical protein [Acidobacteriota bacterium]
MNKQTAYGTALVLGHALVATVHGLAHQRLAIELTVAQELFILIIITLAPLASMFLLWTRLRRVGGAILLLSMLGSLVFGAVNHFMITSPDHVQHLAQGTWRLPFQITAVLLAVTEIIGCWIGAGIWLMKASR